jgi:hypothetical protein
MIGIARNLPINDDNARHLAGLPVYLLILQCEERMGRTMRARDPRSAIDWVRDAADYHGIDTLFLVDDDFFRSPQWEPLLLGLAVYASKASCQLHDAGRYRRRRVCRSTIWRN